jgi:predicted ATPase
MIEKIEIQNYKSIRELDLDLKPINILIGSNGAGKSNFISFFKLVNQMHEGRLNEFVAKYGVESLLYFGRKESDNLYGLLDFDNVNAYSFKLIPSIRDQFTFLFEHGLFNWKHNKEKFYPSWYATRFGTGHQESKLKNSRESIAIYVQRQLASFKVYHFHDTSENSKMKQPSRIDDNEFLREDASNLAAYLYLLQEKHPKTLRRIERTVSSIAPFFKGFNLKPNNLNPDRIKLEWTEKGSDMYLDAHNLSDGTLRFIALTTLLLQPDLPSTIIIDEPELGLHPAAIARLAALIRKASAKSQVIISTQSVNLVDEFQPEDIITVDRKDKQSVFNRQNTHQLSEWLNDYTMSTLWEKNIIGGRP